MRDPAYVKQIVVRPGNCNPTLGPNNSFWDAFSCDGGYSGVLPLFAELDRLFPDEKWDDASHAYVLKIKQAIEQKGIAHLSLYGGLAGTCWALQQVAQPRGRYQKLMATLNEHLLNSVEAKFLAPLRENILKGEPSEPALYEHIQGITGIAVYGLNNLALLPFLELVKDSITLLIGLAKPIKVAGEWVPGWLVPARFQTNAVERERFPGGSFNLGLSHGITGVLAFLAIASLKGIHLPGQTEAMEYISYWLKEHRKKHAEAYFWEATIAHGQDSKDPNKPFVGRDAWCYGTPGVARSLFLAGRALGSASLKQFALESFSSLFLRSRHQWHLPGPTICHGIAGLLMITQLMARETQSAGLLEQTKLLEELLLGYYSPQNPFGFRDFSPSEEGRYAEVDRVDFLEGVPPVLLTLLTQQNSQSSSWWHAPFLIGEGG